MKRFLEMMVALPMFLLTSYLSYSFLKTLGKLWDGKYVDSLDYGLMVVLVFLTIVCILSMVSFAVLFLIGGSK